METVKFKFENIKSKDEFLIETYFKDFPKIRKRDWHYYIEQVLDVMEKDGVVSKGYHDIIPSIESGEDEDIIIVGSKERGINIGFSVNTDKSTQSKFSLANPFGKGGFSGLEFSIGFYKTLNGTVYYNDRFGNKIALSKSTQEPIIKNENFKTDETTLSYSFPIYDHIFSISASDSDASILSENTNKEHKAHTGSSYKTSLGHTYKFFKANELINPNNALYGKIQSEIALPHLSSCSFFKSHFNLTRIFPLYKDMFSCKLDFSLGGIFNFNTAKETSMTPYTDRFFNGKTFNFPGFVDSSLTDPKRSTYLGSNFFYTFRTSLLYKLNENANLMFYNSFGNTILTLGTKDENNLKNTISSLFSSKSIRSAVGFGVSVDLGPACFEGSIVKPLLHSRNDQLNTFALEINFKL